MVYTCGCKSFIAAVSAALQHSVSQKMAKRRACMFNFWQSNSKKQIVSQDQNEEDDDDLNIPADHGNLSDSDFNASDSMEQIDNTEEEHDEHEQPQGDIESDVISGCERVCCANDTVPYQSIDKLSLQQLKTASNERKGCILTYVL